MHRREVKVLSPLVSKGAIPAVQLVTRRVLENIGILKYYIYTEYVGHVRSTLSEAGIPSHNMADSFASCALEASFSCAPGMKV